VFAVDDGDDDAKSSDFLLPCFFSVVLTNSLDDEYLRKQEHSVYYLLFHFFTIILNA
jgi:hypothetical protein